MKTIDLTNIIPVDYIQERFFIDDEGTLRWTHSELNKINVRGKKAGQNRNNGYVRITIFYNEERRDIYAHRIAWVLHHGEWASSNVHLDHKNHDKTDQSIDNLRLANPTENCINTRPYASSGFKGVYTVCNAEGEPTGKYRVVIKDIASGKYRHIGTYDSKIVAALAYDYESYKRGPFSYLNFPELIAA